MRVAVYCRVSTDKQELENQLIELRNFVVNKQWTIYREYCDITSGAKETRPQFDLMFLEAYQRKFDLLIFWSLDRFSRSGTLFTLQKLKQLENCGVEWISYKEPYFNTSGEFKPVVISIMSTLAKLEREKISERTKAGLKRAKNVGKRGKDKRRRKFRKDIGIKRGIKKEA